MRNILRWALWLWITLCTLGAFYWAPLAEGFVGQSSRILFFHVPMAWASFLGFMAAGVWSVLYLAKDRRPALDHRAGAAIEVAFVFCILATVTGAIWAKVMWGAYWNWDPRQTSITVTLLFYAAYLVFRSAVEDPERRATLSAAYASLGLIVAPFFYFILPRITFSLHRTRWSTPKVRWTWIRRCSSYCSLALELTLFSFFGYTVYGFAK